MENNLCIRNAHLVDVAGGQILSGQSVILQDGKIHQITETVPKTRGETLDATGLYLCPGLIDCHVHFFWDAGPDPRGTYLGSDDKARMALAQHNARIALAAGITTMRDLAAPAPLMFEFQRQVERGQVPGPHIISCGYALMRPKGHCHFMGGGEVSTVEEVYRLSEAQLAQGAGFVKLMASGGGLTPGTVPHEADLPLELMRAAAEVAHAHGVQITAHCHATESIERAVDAGLDMIEHANFVEPPGRYRYDEDIAKHIRDQGIVVSPTAYGALQTARRFRQTGDAHNPNDVAAVERLEGRVINTAHFHRLGMKIIAGTDCGATNSPFDCLIDELLTYTQAGLSNGEALQSATSRSAEYLALPERGQIKEGYWADLTLLQGNPLEDLNRLRTPLKVFKSGQLVHPRPISRGGDRAD
jgi:imidazolonepropionase-like amidohydrolase